MTIEFFIAYLIMILCTINDIAKTGSDKVNHAIDFIENNTKGRNNLTSQRLSNNLRLFWKRVIRKSFELLDKAKYILSWKCDMDKYDDSIWRLIVDSNNFVLEDEFFFRIDQYRDEIVVELIKQRVLIGKGLEDDLNRTSSKAFGTVKAIATLISYSNAIWFLTRQALHLISNLAKMGIGNSAVQYKLNNILDDEECIYKNFNKLLYQTANGYLVNNDAVKMVSNHTLDLEGLLELVEKKAKWLFSKETDKSKDQEKEKNTMSPSTVQEPETDEYDSPEFYRISRYESTKMIAQQILVAEDMGKLNYDNFPEFISDLRKWGVEIDPFFESDEFGDAFTQFMAIEMVSMSVTDNNLCPLVKIPDNISINQKKYFKECIIQTAIALEKEHSSENPDLYGIVGNI